jgi:hypothetical protein
LNKRNEGTEEVRKIPLVSVPPFLLFNSGSVSLHGSVPRAETAFVRFSRPYGTDQLIARFPGTEVPGYYHGVPLGRDFIMTALGVGRNT